MSRGDITLPNQSGQIDPRLERDRDLKLQKSYLAQEQARKLQPKKKEALIRVIAKGFKTLGDKD